MNHHNNDSIPCFVFMFAGNGEQDEKETRTTADAEFSKQKEISNTETVNSGDSNKKPQCISRNDPQRVKIQKPPDIVANTRANTPKVYATLEPEFTSSESDSETANIANSHPTNLRDYYLRIDSPERLFKMIKRFKLEGYIGVEDTEALLYFNPDEIPIEKQMLKAVRKAVLALLSDIPIRRRKNRVLSTFEETQQQELERFEKQNTDSLEVKQHDFQLSKPKSDRKIQLSSLKLYCPNLKQ